MSEVQETKKLAKKARKSIVKPSVEVEGETHQLEQMMQDGEAPILTSIGYARLSKGQQHNWVSYVIKTRGDKVISIDVDEPNMRAIAEETSKINFATEFMDDL